MKYAPPIGQEAQGEAAHYIDGNPELGILGSPVPAAALEPVQRELVHVIREAGLQPSGEDLTQLWQAICKIIGIKAPLATLLRAGLMQPDGVTTQVDEDGLLSALGGNLLLNSEEWITASGTFTAKATGWHHLWMINGGQSGDGFTWNSSNHQVTGGVSGGILESLIYLEGGQSVDVVIGAGGIPTATSTGMSGNGGGMTSFGALTPNIAHRFFGSFCSVSAEVGVRAYGGGIGGGEGLFYKYAERPSANSGSFYGAGGGAAWMSSTGYNCGSGAQGAIWLRWHDPAKAAGPLPAPALLSARRMAPRAAAVPVTVNLYDPATGQGSVWREGDAPAKLADGLITQEAWLEICAQKAAEERAAWLASPDTVEERFEMLRMACEAKLTATDKLTAPDYPISEEDRAAVNAYRKAIRELNHQPGAPWDGGGEATPWPEMPTVTKVQEA